MLIDDFGYEAGRVQVLLGGFPEWDARGYPTETGPYAPVEPAGKFPSLWAAMKTR